MMLILPLAGLLENDSGHSDYAVFTGPGTVLCAVCVIEWTTKSHHKWKVMHCLFKIWFGWELLDVQACHSRLQLLRSVRLHCVSLGVCVCLWNRGGEFGHDWPGARPLSRGLPTLQFQFIWSADINKKYQSISIINNVIQIPKRLN